MYQKRVKKYPIQQLNCFQWNSYLGFAILFSWNLYLLGRIAIMRKYEYYIFIWMGFIVGGVAEKRLWLRLKLPAHLISSHFISCYTFDSEKSSANKDGGINWIGFRFEIESSGYAIRIYSNKYNKKCNSKTYLHVCNPRNVDLELSLLTRRRAMIHIF